ncbi:MAG TPA: metal-dependent hydrolase [Candidatus Acidoferrales bacterium]|jgi:membrane-bound metal-dependent hydrolase YbcI (DUF457 family)
MDTITHGIVGALAGKALFGGRDIPAGFAENGVARALSSPTARVAILGCTIGSVFPDIDIFAGPLAHNPLAIMEWHRNITHSAIMLPFWAFLLALLSIPIARLLKWKSPPLLTLFAAYSLGIATHIFLDLVTSFGTMVWSPLQYSRSAWDWIFILDLTLTAIALAPQLAAWCYREPAQFKQRAIGVWALLTLGAFGAYLFARASGYGFAIFILAVASAIFGAIIFLPAIQDAGFRWTRANWCRAALVVLCAYVGLAATAHHKAFADVQRYAAGQHWQVENLAALPLPPTLTHWVGLVNTPEGVWRTTLHEPSGAVENTVLYAGAQPSELIEEARKLRDVQMFLWFARYPVWRMRKRNGQQTVIDIFDVRFFREGVTATPGTLQSPRGNPNGRARDSGFAFRIVFDMDGRIVSHGFR